MIHQKRLIAYILVFTIILIFFMNIDSSNAAQVAIPLGVELGVPMAKAFLGFLLASRASGLAYDSYEQAREMFRVIPGGQSNDNPPPNDPPPDEQGPDGKFTWKDFLGLGLIGGAVTQQLKDFIDSFKNKFGEVQQGENVIGNEYDIIQQNYSDSFYITEMPVTKNLIINGNEIIIVNFEPLEDFATIPKTYKDISLSVTWPDGSTDTVIRNDFYTAETYSIYYNHVNWKNKIFITNGMNLSLTWDIPSSYVPHTINTNNINYYITNNAPMLNPVQNPPPEKVYIPYLPDLDPANDKLKQVTLPSGEEQLVYEGTPDDYLNDVVNNVTFTQIQTGAVPGVTVTPTEEGYIILEPGTNELPYPDIGTDPFPDTNQGLGTIASLIKAIINWLSNIYNAILSIPQFLANLFTIPEGLTIDTSNLRMNGFTEKFPFSIPWDIYNAINVFASSPSNPDIAVNIDTDNLKINHTIDLTLIDLPLRFARYAVTIFFIIFLASKTRDLIKW